MSFGPWQIILILLVFAMVWALYIWPSWRVARRAGYSGAWSLLIVFPVVNIIALYVFAFSDWPVLKKKRASMESGAQGAIERM